MYNLCQSIPKFPKDKKLDESKFDLPKNKDKGFYSKEVRNLLPKIYNIEEVIKPKPLLEINWGQKYRDKFRNYTDLNEGFHSKVRNYFSINLKIKDPVTDFIEQSTFNMPYMVEGRMKQYKSDLKINNIMDPNKPMFINKGEAHLKYLNYGLIPGGFPQGMPMSPFLSILALEKYLSQQDSTSYADDPLFYSNTDFKVVDESENGVINSPEKSS